MSGPTARAIVIVLMAAVPAAAQSSFSNADLAGRYTMRTQLGVVVACYIVADGAGEVSEGRCLALETSTSITEHSVTGRYDVQPDGLGAMSLTFTPELFQLIDFLNARIMLTTDGKDFHLLAPSISAGAGVILATFERQDTAEVVQRLEFIEARLDDFEAKQCEQIRLELTPQGQRASDCCGPEMGFPDGKDAPSCRGTVLNDPLGPLPPAPSYPPPVRR